MNLRKRLKSVQGSEIGRRKCQQKIVVSQTVINPEESKLFVKVWKYNFSFKAWCKQRSYSVACFVFLFFKRHMRSHLLFSPNLSYHNAGPLCVFKEAWECSRVNKPPVWGAKKKWMRNRRRVVEKGIRSLPWTNSVRRFFKEVSLILTDCWEDSGILGGGFWCHFSLNCAPDCIFLRETQSTESCMCLT